MYLELAWIFYKFFYRNLILFSEKYYKNRAQLFLSKHSLLLHIVEIFCSGVTESKKGGALRIKKGITNLRKS